MTNFYGPSHYLQVLQRDLESSLDLTYRTEEDLKTDIGETAYHQGLTMIDHLKKQARFLDSSFRRRQV